MNRWKLEEIEFIDISYKIPYEMAEQYLDQEYNESVEVLF